jgi:hypothetical protein
LINAEVARGGAWAVDEAPADAPRRRYAVVTILLVNAVLLLAPPGIALLALIGILR